MLEYVVCVLSRYLYAYYIFSRARVDKWSRGRVAHASEDWVPETQPVNVPMYKRYK